MSDPVSFAAQIGPEHLATIAEQGFKSVINNRPDFEHGPDQPTSQSIGQAATDAGLAYVFQPVISGQITPQDVETFAAHFNTLPKPVLMFCRTGGRASQLYNLARQADLLNL